jgi:PAS domain S-box-containing protein
MTDAPALLDLAFDAIGEALVVTDGDGVIVRWNRAAADLYGWDADEVIGRPIGTPLPLPKSGAGVLPPLGARRPWSAEFPVPHRFGRVLWVHVSTWPIGSGDADVAGFVLLSYEVPPQPAVEGEQFDPDATAVEIVARAFDSRLRAAVDADPHGTVLPNSGLTLAQLDDLLASLVALAVHTATVGAETSGATTEEIVAAAALRLRQHV